MTADLVAARTWRAQRGGAPGGRFGSATLTEDGRCRLMLARTSPRAALSGEPPTMTWIMLNPSAADATHDDPTLRRCLGYADREGCTVLRVVNLVPTVATLPARLPHEPFPAWWEDDNISAIEMATLCGTYRGRYPLVMLGWGAHARRVDLRERAERVMRLLHNHQVPAWCLGWTAGEHPVHPLRQRTDAPLQPVNTWARPQARDR